MAKLGRRYAFASFANDWASRHFDPEANRVETISADETATRLGICVGSVQKLIREGVLPATQLLPSAPW
jgi:hypothetical protein